MAQNLGAGAIDLLQFGDALVDRLQCLAVLDRCEEHSCWPEKLKGTDAVRPRIANTPPLVTAREVDGRHCCEVHPIERRALTHHRFQIAHLT